jgi:hypothetical protein
MENQINSDNEMYLLSKYKYLNRLTKTAVKVTANTMTNNVKIAEITQQAKKNVSEEDKAKKKAEAEALNKIKEEKKRKMAEMCKPGAKSESKTKFVEKEKYTDNTPKGQKKGKKIKIKIKNILLFYRYVKTNDSCL